MPPLNTSRLASELRRLYLCPNPACASAEDVVASHSPAPPGMLFDQQGQTRTLVFEVAAPADWELLGAVWRGVQADWGWPAPAIAASGTQGLQLWFSLREPLPAAQAHHLLGALRQHYLPELPAARVRLWPRPTGVVEAQAQPFLHARLVPAPAGSNSGDNSSGTDTHDGNAASSSQGQNSGNWSAFVAPDLAPLFAETPWLDIPPGDEGQATLLANLRSLTAAQLRQIPAMPAASATSATSATPGVLGEPATLGGHGTQASDAGHTGPRAFLLSVMNDTQAPLALRIEAAKALLPFDPSR